MARPDAVPWSPEATFVWQGVTGPHPFVATWSPDTGMVADWRTLANHALADGRPHPRIRATYTGLPTLSVDGLTFSPDDAGWAEASQAADRADRSLVHIHALAVHHLVEALQVAAAQALVGHPLAPLLPVLPRIDPDAWLTAPGLLRPVDTLERVRRGVQEFHPHSVRPDHELARRGLSQAPSMPSVDAALAYWQGLQASAHAHLGPWPSDPDVRDDPALQAWLADLREGGRLRRLGPITTRAELAELLAVLWWCAAGSAWSPPQLPR